MNALSSIVSFGNRQALHDAEWLKKREAYRSELKVRYAEEMSYATLWGRIRIYRRIRRKVGVKFPSIWSQRAKAGIDHSV